MNRVCLPPLAGPAPCTQQQPPQPPPRRLAATVARLPAAPPPAAPGAGQQCGDHSPLVNRAAEPCAVALQAARSPPLSPFADVSLQTALPPLRPAQNSRPPLGSAGSAPALSAAERWLMAIGKLEAEQTESASLSAFSLPWDAAPVPTLPPSPHSAQHAREPPPPRSRSLDNTSHCSSSSPLDGGCFNAPCCDRCVICTHSAPAPRAAAPALARGPCLAWGAAKGCCRTHERPSDEASDGLSRLRHLACACSVDLLDLMGAGPLDSQLLPLASTYCRCSIGASGRQQSAPLSMASLPPRQPAATLLGCRTASGSIGQKRLCTWDEHPQQPAPAMRRSRSSAAVPLPAPAPACLPEQQEALAARFEAQQQKLVQLLLQLQQVRAAMQHDAAT